MIDWRLLLDLRAMPPVVFDGTHSVQQRPAAGGRPEFTPPIARASIASGVDFLGLNDDPASSPTVARLQSKTLMPRLETLLDIQEGAARRVG